MPHWRTDDIALLVELVRAHAARDEVPAALLEGARAAFTWRTVDAELAELSYDSLFDAALAVRSDDQDVRALAFSGSAATVELELDGGDVLGQVLPPGPAEVVVQTPDATHDLTASAGGFFSAPGPAGRPFRLWFRPVGGGWVVTDWTRA